MMSTNDFSLRYGWLDGAAGKVMAFFYVEHQSYMMMLVAMAMREAEFVPYLKSNFSDEGIMNALAVA